MAVRAFPLDFILVSYNDSWGTKYLSNLNADEEETELPVQEVLDSPDLTSYYFSQSVLFLLTLADHFHLSQRSWDLSHLTGDVTCQGTWIVLIIFWTDN